MKFKKGDIVKFSNRDAIHTYITDIPDQLLNHGRLSTHKDYERDGATIIAVLEDRELYIVRYKDCDRNYVQLGFKEDCLISMRIENWRERIQ